MVDYAYNDSGIRVSAYSFTVAQNYLDTQDEQTYATGKQTTLYLIDAQNPTGYAQVIAELTYNKANPDPATDTPTSIRSYTIGDDMLAQTDDPLGSGTPEYLLYDGQGSTRQVIDINKVILPNGSYSYDAYGMMLGGNPTAAAPAATNLLYTGEQYDANLQQYYLRARYYNPSNGRFNRMDPFAGNSSDPQSLHKYLYCHANPINAIDPTGQFATLEILTTLTTIVTLAAIFLPPILTIYRSAKGLLEMSEFATCVRDLANKGIISFEEAQEIQHEAFLASKEMIYDAIGATTQIINGIVQQYAYSLAFAAVTRGLAFAASGSVKIAKAGSLAISLGDQARQHHTVFKCAVKPFKRQRLFELPQIYHVGAPEGLHYKILQNERFSRIHPTSGRKILDILDDMGRQEWLDELGESYKWLETDWPGQYKGIYKCYQKAVKSIGGAAGLR